MSTFRNPVGPQPSGVYWRRRLVVLLGLVAVVAIVALIVAQPRGPAPAPSGTAAPTAPATPNPTGTSAADAAPCDPAKVTVEALTDSNGYDAGVNPVLSFVLKSTMTVPCAISAGSDVQEFSITSGDELIWSSSHCQTDAVAAVTVLMPGVPKQGPNLTWDRTRSSTDTCNTEREAVVAGGASYHLSVTVGELSSAETRQFLLY